MTFEIIEPDDLPPSVRECMRASREHDREHLGRCADCLESEVGAILMDAASHRDDGNESIARELEFEAEMLRMRAWSFRSS